MKSPNFLESETLLKVTSRNESSDCMKIYSDKNWSRWSPRKFGEDFQFDEHIFQMGWFNHQPDIVLLNKNSRNKELTGSEQD